MSLPFIPLISIIIPFYNSEKTIVRCIESIVFEPGKSYEIICVDDGSSDRSSELIKSLQRNNANIKLISMGTNKGLYLARLEGIKKSHGKYIGFLDSDDYVSKDYFNILLTTAIKKKTDICVGQIINVNAEGVKYLQTRCARFPYLQEKQDDVNVYNMFWNQAGTCYHWHVVWNKIYKRTLFKKSMRVLKEQKNHLVMTEDFIFSAVVLKNVGSYATNENAKYYYVENQNSQTKNRGEAAIKKSLQDIKNAFDFVENFLKNINQGAMFFAKFYAWKELYHKIWKNNLLDAGISEEDSEQLIYDNWEYYPLQQRQYVDNYYYEVAKILND